MIITRTPLRVSFLGGGTDYPDYYSIHGGETIAMAIKQYTVIVVNRLTKFVDYCVRVNYSIVESVKNVDEIQHPSARECLRFMGINGGIEIHYISDLPARTGLGSSSSATVGLLHALHAFKGDSVSPEQLAAEAVYVEQHCIRERVGSQDQYICALGGFRHLGFSEDGRVSADITVLRPERLQALQNSLLLLYTGKQRTAHEVLSEQMERTATGANTKSLHRLRELVKQGIQALNAEVPLTGFGEILHDSWMLKRTLSSRVSDADIDRCYERAHAAGAVGGKLLGAGGGGFLLLFVQPSKREAVLRALPGLPEAELRLEDRGTSLMFYQDDRAFVMPAPDIREVQLIKSHHA